VCSLNTAIFADNNGFEPSRQVEGTELLNDKAEQSSANVAVATRA